MSRSFTYIYTEGSLKSDLKESDLKSRLNALSNSSNTDTSGYSGQDDSYLLKQRLMELKVGDSFSFANDMQRTRNGDILRNVKWTIYHKEEAGTTLKLYLICDTTFKEKFNERMPEDVKDRKEYYNKFSKSTLRGRVENYVMEKLPVGVRNNVNRFTAKETTTEFTGDFSEIVYGVFGTYSNELPDSLYNLYSLMTEKDKNGKQKKPLGTTFPKNFYNFMQRMKTSMKKSNEESSSNFRNMEKSHMYIQNNVDEILDDKLNSYLKRIYDACLINIMYIFSVCDLDNTGVFSRGDIFFSDDYDIDKIAKMPVENIFELEQKLVNEYNTTTVPEGIMNISKYFLAFKETKKNYRSISYKEGFMTPTKEFKNLLGEINSDADHAKGAEERCANTTKLFRKFIKSNDTKLDIFHFFSKEIGNYISMCGGCVKYCEEELTKSQKDWDSHAEELRLFLNDVEEFKARFNPSKNDPNNETLFYVTDHSPSNFYCVDISAVERSFSKFYKLFEIDKQLHDHLFTYSYLPPHTVGNEPEKSHIVVPYDTVIEVLKGVATSMRNTMRNKIYYKFYDNVDICLSEIIKLKKDIEQKIGKGHKNLLSLVDSYEEWATASASTLSRDENVRDNLSSAYEAIITIYKNNVNYKTEQFICEASILTHEDYVKCRDAGYIKSPSNDEWTATSGIFPDEVILSSGEPDTVNKLHEVRPIIYVEFETESVRRTSSTDKSGIKNTDNSTNSGDTNNNKLSGDFELVF